MSECFGEHWPCELDRAALVVQRGDTHKHVSVHGERRARGSSTQPLRGQHALVALVVVGVLAAATVAVPVNAVAAWLSRRCAESGYTRDETTSPSFDGGRMSRTRLALVEHS
jgi:hypothetical protein